MVRAHPPPDRKQSHHFGPPQHQQQSLWSSQAHLQEARGIGSSTLQGQMDSRERRPWAAPVPGTVVVDRTPPWSPGCVTPRCACDTDEETGTSSYTWYLACRPRATTVAEAGRAQVWNCRAAVSRAPRSVCALGRPDMSSLQSLGTHCRFGAGVDSGKVDSMKRQNDRMLKEELPRSVGAQYATGDP